MKKLLSAALWFCLPILTFAQTKTPTLTVKGICLDSVSGKPIGYATASLLNAQTQQPVKAGLTREDGSFELKAAAGKNYKLTIVSIGYQTKTLLIASAGKEINTGKIMMQPSSNQLKEVSVTAVKPLIKQEIDRITYDVQADPETKTQNVLDMLRKVPLVTVDANDNIQLKGQSNYKILINGKPSALVAHNPSDVFKAMPASSIQKIEIITTPPAKYDAEGLAGIINIITNKKIDEGYNASINLRDNSLYGPGGGVSFTVKKGKFGLDMYSGVSQQIKRHSSSQQTLQTFGDNPTYLKQSFSNTNSGHFLYTGEELSFEADSLNLITAQFNLNSGHFNSGSDQSSNEFDQVNSLIQSYQVSTAGLSHWHGIDLGLNYQLGFKRSKDQLLTLSYRYSKSGNDNNTGVNIFNRFNYGLPSYQQQNNANTAEQTYQLDYAQPLKKLNIEGGLKAILRKNTSSYGNSDLDTLTGAYTTDPKSVNDFNYDQNIYSFYNSYQLNLKSWGFKGGLRVEHTSVDANFVSVSSQATQNYNNFIPSISVLRHFKDGSSFNLGFTNRIQRPDIYELNPFVDETNPRFISTGNPNLRPVVNHTFELNYTRFSKGSINIGMSYAFSNNTIQNVTRLIDTVSYSTNENLGSDRNIGLNASVNYPITKKLNLNVNGRASYEMLRGYFNGQLYNNRGVQGYMFAYAGYRFTDTWRAGIDGGFYSPNVMLQGKSSSEVFTSLSTSLDVLKKKGSFYIAVNNPFEKNRTYNSYTRDPAFYQTSMSVNPVRSFNIGFSYRFGKLKGDIKKNQHGIQNDDTKGNTQNSGGSNK